MIMRKQKADYILENSGIVTELSRFGKVHVVGSARTGLMSSNDIDIYVDNSAMSIDHLYEFTSYILRTFRPTWYEAKEEMNREGKLVYFHGFEAVIASEKWNFDIWFFDRDTINEAEALCERIEREINEYPAKKNAVMEIKNALITKGLYSFDKYTGMDVYKAVFDMNIMSFDAFFDKFCK